MSAHDSDASPESGTTPTREPQHKCPGCGKMVDDAWGTLCVVCGAPPSPEPRYWCTGCQQHYTTEFCDKCDGLGRKLASPPVEPREPTHFAQQFKPMSVGTSCDVSCLRCGQPESRHSGGVPNLCPVYSTFAAAEPELRAPKLRESTLSEIESAIIAATGDGPSAAYVVEFLRKIGPHLATLTASLSTVRRDYGELTLRYEELRSERNKLNRALVERDKQIANWHASRIEWGKRVDKAERELRDVTDEAFEWRDRALAAESRALAAEQRIEAMRAGVTEAAGVLRWLNIQGGLGHRMHAEIERVLVALATLSPNAETPT